MGCQSNATAARGRQDIRCQTPHAAWDTADNLVPITKYYTSGVNRNRVQSLTAKE